MDCMASVATCAGEEGFLVLFFVDSGRPLRYFISRACLVVGGFRVSPTVPHPARYVGTYVPTYLGKNEGG